MRLWPQGIAELGQATSVLRKNTGDDRRRTHDMNTANSIPDFFLQRVEAGDDRTLFSPNEVPDLHDLYGKPFNGRCHAN